MNKAEFVIMLTTNAFLIMLICIVFMLFVVYFLTVKTKKIIKKINEIEEFSLIYEKRIKEIDKNLYSTLEYIENFKKSYSKDFDFNKIRKIDEELQKKIKKNKNNLIDNFAPKMQNRQVKNQLKETSLKSKTNKKEYILNEDDSIKQVNKKINLENTLVSKLKKIKKIINPYTDNNVDNNVNNVDKIKKNIENNNEYLYFNNKKKWR